MYQTLERVEMKKTGGLYSEGMLDEDGNELQLAKVYQASAKRIIGKPKWLDTFDLKQDMIAYKQRPFELFRDLSIKI